MLPGQHSVLFLNEPARCAAGLTLSVQFPLEQMICGSSPCLSPSDVKVEELAEADIPEMLALTKLTEPGPFRDRTIYLGGYCGIRDQGHLVAMAGRRTAIPGCKEVSAVCTHPSYRGRGYGAALVCAVSDRIVRGGGASLSSRPAEQLQCNQPVSSPWIRDQPYVLLRGRGYGWHAIRQAHVTTD